MLELRNIEKYYNPGTINEMCLFDKFNLTVDKGEFVSVVGSNGSGKTSMLNILCGSIPVDGGQILMNGEDITTKKEFKRNQKIGRVYQNPAMGTCPTMTILENMSLCEKKQAVVSSLKRETKTVNPPKLYDLESIGLTMDMPEFNHQVELTTGVMEEECSQMMKSFFKELREARKKKKQLEKEQTEEI